MGLCLSVKVPCSTVKSRNSTTNRKNSRLKRKAGEANSRSLPIAHGSQHSSRGLSVVTGTTDEEFYDAQSWLDPVEDDYFSFSGELIPSRQGTPLGRSVSHGNCGISTPPGKVPLGNPMRSKSERLSINLSKRLEELFKESFRDHQHIDNDIEMQKRGKGESGEIPCFNPESRNWSADTDFDKTSPNVGRAEIVDDGMLTPTQCCFSGRAAFERRKKTSTLGKNPTGQ